MTEFGRILPQTQKAPAKKLFINCSEIFLPFNSKNPTPKDLLVLGRVCYLEPHMTILLVSGLAGNADIPTSKIAKKHPLFRARREDNFGNRHFGKLMWLLRFISFAKDFEEKDNRQ